MARKSWMVICAIAVVCWLSCRVAEHQRNPEKYYQQTPSKTESQEVLSNGEVLGYVHKYEWETADGQKPYYYVVYDRKGNLVGRIRKDGYTVWYTEEGKEKELGHLTLAGALERIYDTPHLQVIGADQDAEYISWRQPTTAAAEKSGSTGLRQQPRTVEGRKTPEKSDAETEEETGNDAENDGAEGE